MHFGIYIVVILRKYILIMKENYDYLDGRTIITILILVACAALFVTPYFI